MSATLVDTSADAPRTIAELQQQFGEMRRELDERAAERDAALAREAATAEVLQLINSSPGDLAPVFGSLLEKALALCDAAFGHLMTLSDDRRFVTEAARGDERAVEWTKGPQPFTPAPDGPLQRIIEGEEAYQIADFAATEGYRAGHPTARGLVDVAGARTVLAVALRHADGLLGAIVFYRQEVRPFSDRQIALVGSFAAQAVIAMQNARLLGQLRQRTSDLEESLEYQTATSEVLKALSRSTFDLDAILQTVVETAHRLCRSDYSVIFRNETGEYRFAAGYGNRPEYEESERQAVIRPGRGTIVGRAALEGCAVQIKDALTDPEYEDKEAARINGAHSMLGVPLLREGQVIGAFGLARNRVEPFSDREVELMTTFADQAAIAIDNARLLTELRRRTGDLEEALEYQTAISDVLKVISSSTFDLDTVMEAMVASAIRLCRAEHCGVYRNVDGNYRWAGGYAPTSEYEARERDLVIRPGPGTLVGRAALAGRVVQIEDAWTDPSYDAKDDVRDGGVHTLLGVPLLRQGMVIGVFGLARKRVELFTDREVSLVTTFADQAVIAMENARLLGELRQRTRDLEESLEYQTATSDVLQVISRSTFDVSAVLEFVCDTAARLCRVQASSIFLLDGGRYRWAAGLGVNPEYRAIEERQLIAAGTDTLVGRVALAREVVHILDAMADPDYERKDDLKVAGARSILGVPLLRDGIAVGVICLAREAVQAFSDKQIELVRTFADQAVIAIENTRLITETREALEQQTATAEVLGVINSSPGDLAPVFETILQKAHLLCGATLGSLFLYDGEKMSAMATFGYPEDVAAVLRNGILPPPPLLHGARLVHRHDIREGADEDIRAGADEVVRLISQRGGVRTNLIVPLRKDGVLHGMISCNRREVRPYTEKQIALLENFAAQAVIAIDNARLLDEIRQRQAELRVTFDNMGDGVAMFDADLKLAAWNRNFQQILDVPDAVLTPRPSYEDYLRFLAGRGEFGTEDAEAELRWRLDRTDEEIRFERARPDGRVIEVRRNAVPGGGFVLIYGDITERKAAEAEIHAARDAAEKALAELSATQQQLVVQQKMAALGQLTAGIAHEIKNPLNFVNNFAGLSNELLAELKETAAPAWETLDAERRAEIDETIEMLSGNLEKIAEHGRRADGIVKSMLDHSRGSSAERRIVDINALVEEALNLAYHGVRAQNQNFNITLERDLDGGLAPIELVPQDVTRVFLNVIGNGFYAANKRREQGDDPAFRPIFKVTTRETDGGVEVRLRDNGIGIRREHRDRLFQPFFTTKPTGEGTGLGLSISYDIITQQHGGTIEVDSEPGEFTEFIIRLPRQAQRANGRAA